MLASELPVYRDTPKVRATRIREADMTAQHGVVTKTGEATMTLFLSAITPTSNYSYL